MITYEALTNRPKTLKLFVFVNATIVVTQIILPKIKWIRKQLAKIWNQTTQVSFNFGVFDIEKLSVDENETLVSRAVNSIRNQNDDLKGKGWVKSS